MENLKQSTSHWRWPKFPFLSMPARMQILVEWEKKERGDNNTDPFVMVSLGPKPVSQSERQSNVHKGQQGKGGGKKLGMNPFLELLLILKCPSRRDNVLFFSPGLLCDCI